MVIGGMMMSFTIFAGSSNGVWGHCGLRSADGLLGSNVMSLGKDAKDVETDVETVPASDSAVGPE